MTQEECIKNVYNYFKGDGVFIYCTDRINFHWHMYNLTLKNKMLSLREELVLKYNAKVTAMNGFDISYEDMINFLHDDMIKKIERLKEILQ